MIQYFKHREKQIYKKIMQGIEEPCVTTYDFENRLFGDFKKNETLTEDYVEITEGIWKQVIRIIHDERLYCENISEKAARIYCGYSYSKVFENGINDNSLKIAFDIAKENIKDFIEGIGEKYKSKISS